MCYGKGLSISECVLNSMLFALNLNVSLFYLNVLECIEYCVDSYPAFSLIVGFPFVKKKDGKVAGSQGAGVLFYLYF